MRTSRAGHDQVPPFDKQNRRAVVGEDPLQLVEDDYLGGQGSRGSGRVAFQGLTLTCKSTEQYQAGQPVELNLKQIDRSGLLQQMRSRIPVAAGAVNGGD